MPLDGGVKCRCKGDESMSETVIAIVKFEFEVQGPMAEAEQSIREQISSDTNEYYQADDERAQLVRWEIMDFRTK